MALTGKKLAFAKAVLAGKPNKEAAIAAGYSAKTASPAGSRLAKDEDVRKYVTAAKKKSKTKTAKAPPIDDGEPDLFDKTDDPREFLKAAMNNPALDPRQRIDAAKALMPFEHQKLGEGGKKQTKMDAAKKAAGGGKFASGSAPKLAAANGKRL